MAVNGTTAAGTVRRWRLGQTTGMLGAMLAGTCMRSPMSRGCLAGIALLVLVASAPAAAQGIGSGEIVDAAEASLQDLARQIRNPVGALSNLTVDNALVSLDGGARDHDLAYTASLEPQLPVRMSQLGLGSFSWARDYHLVTQLSVPVFETLEVGRGDQSNRRSGLGDIQLGAAFAPVRESGVVWGVGPTFILPSASRGALGQGKWQAGPAALAGYVAEHWTAYALGQQWWSFAGDRSRSRTSQLSLEYVLLGHLPHGWQVGMQPTMDVDWTAASRNRVQLPVGLGFGKTVRLGSLPVQLWVEADYYVVRPDDLASPRWGLDLQIVPVLGGGS